MLAIEVVTSIIPGNLESWKFFPIFQVSWFPLPQVSDVPGFQFCSILTAQFSDIPGFQHLITNK